MHRDSSGIDSELRFEQQMALHASETAVLCLFPRSLHIIEPKIIIHKIIKD